MCALKVSEKNVAKGFLEISQVPHYYFFAGVGQLAGNNSSRNGSTSTRYQRYPLVSVDQ